MVQNQVLRFNLNADVLAKRVFWGCLGFELFKFVFCPSLFI